MLDKPSQQLAKSDLDRREINRRAVKHWAVIRSMITNMHGAPIGGLARLSPHFNERHHAAGVKRHGAPRLVEFRGPSPYPNDDGSGPGSWFDVGTGKSGPDLISLIEQLGERDRERATAFLRDLTDRLVELAA